MEFLMLSLFGIVGLFSTVELIEIEEKNHAKSFKCHSKPWRLDKIPYSDGIVSSVKNV